LLPRQTEKVPTAPCATPRSPVGMNGVFGHMRNSPPTAWGGRVGVEDDQSAPNPLADRRTASSALFQMWVSRHHSQKTSKALGNQDHRCAARLCLDAARVAGRSGSAIPRPACGPGTADRGCSTDAAEKVGWRPCSMSPSPFSHSRTSASTMLSPRRLGPAVIAEAECYRRSRHIGLLHPRLRPSRCDAKDPIAAAAGTFMLGTKGEVTRPQSIRPRGDGPGDQAMSTLLGCLSEVRKSGERGPAAPRRFLGALDADRAVERHGLALTRMR